jgi:hypothetical protein
MLCAHTSSYLTPSNLYELSKKCNDGYKVIKKLYDQGLYNFDTVLNSDRWNIYNLLRHQLTGKSDIRITEFILEHPNIIGDLRLDDDSDMRQIKNAQFYNLTENEWFIENVCKENIILVKFQLMFTKNLEKFTIQILNICLQGPKTRNQLLCIELVIESLLCRGDIERTQQFCESNIDYNMIYKFYKCIIFNKYDMKLWIMICTLTNLDKHNLNIVLNGDISRGHRALNCLDVMWCIKEFL